jgi:glycosyltransferase involved in cell wall biosynthesis
LRRGAASVCLVAPCGPGVKPELAHHPIRVAAALAPRGFRVHLLLCGPIDRGMQDRLAADGLGCTWLDDIRCPATSTLDGPHLFPALHDGDRVLFALQILHEQHRFDLIGFPERGGLGFRTVQAKQTGQAFTDTVLAATLHGPSPALRHAYQQWLNSAADLTLDYAERYAFEHADVQWTTQPQWFAEAERLGWMVGPAAVLLPEEPPDLAETFARCLARRPHPTTIPDPPQVTVAVPYYNLPPFLGETLASLERQTYPHLDVLVINDGSTEPEAVRVFDELRGRHPRFRFISQENRGIGATRNRGLQEAQGELFLPVDADNVAHPDMVRRFVLAMQHNQELAALTCYFLAFRQSADIDVGRFAYAYKPTGGPRVLGCLHNVYGDGNAMFRTAALRAVGGFSTDRETSFEDWEVFVKLASAGQRVDVVPDFLFHYRHRDAGFSRATNPYQNHQRVLRRYVEIAELPEQERAVLWNLLAGYQYRVTELEDANRTLTTRLAARRYRMVDRVKDAVEGLYRRTIGQMRSGR